MVTKRSTYYQDLLNRYSDPADKNGIKVGGALKSFYFDCRVRNLTEKTIWGEGEFYLNWR